GKTYQVMSTIDSATGGSFTTPSVFTITAERQLKETLDTVVATQNVVTNKLEEQKQIIIQKMSEQKQYIQEEMTKQTQVLVGTGKTPEQIIAQGGIVGMVESTMKSFERATQESLRKLEAGADQAVKAGQMLEATALKYSWNAVVSPDPALTGDTVTLQCQGPAGRVPVLNIYSWDNKPIVSNYPLVETQPGLYVYNFQADAKFTPGKAYTYIITESTTGGMITGSGLVESMSMTTIAGLAAAAPEAERAAKKALDAIKALEAVLISGEPVNIALTLKNLKESVDALPEVLSKEGPSAKIVQTINEISERLITLVGEEGYNLKELLGEMLGENPELKEVRAKTDAISAIVDLLLQLFEAKFGGVDSPVVSTYLQPGSIIFRIVAANPSKTKTQKVKIKSYLPVEVKPKDVLDTGGLELEYDPEKNIYYVYKEDVELAPAEIRVFEVEVEDIWIIPAKEINNLKERVDTILEKLKDAPEYLEKAKEIADTVYPRLDEILRSQSDESVSRQQHIGIYRQNLIVLEKIKEDIAKMEKILVTAGGPPAPEMLAKTRIKAEEPTKTMTWLVIFVIIIFTGLLSLVLFFTWQKQAKIMREEILSAKRSAFPETPTEENLEEKK
ncbi:MAG: hypothetical protein N2Z79_01805, partial [Candidatus Omnitrophica bacterium]|nr:hypothetical protein [Candidatus Omnitrophota bacterium]